MYVQATSADGSSAINSFVVSVGDVNDNSPQWVSGASGNVAENAPTSTVIYTAQASDADASAPNNNVVYSLKAGQGDADLLEINSTSGAVTLKASANREAKASYSFTVVATDGGDPALSAEQEITVGVSDVNEAPTAIQLSASSVAENLAVGATVATLSASDPDAQGSVFAAPFSYALVAGAGDADNAAFAVVGNELRLVGSANYEQQASYSVRLRVSDNGGLSHEEVKTISVVDVPEVAGVSMSADGAENGLLNAGDTVRVSLRWDQNVVVDTTNGTPTISVMIGATPVSASYLSGSGSDTLVFALTVQSGQNDSDGLSVLANSLALNGGTIRSNEGMNATLAHSGLAAQPDFLVDTEAPTIDGVTASWGSELNTPESQVDGTVTVLTSGVEHGQQVRVVLNGVQYFAAVDNNSATVTVPSFQLLALSNQSSYTLGVTVSDAAGNPALEHNSTSFTVNTAAPAVQSATPSWGAVLNATEDNTDGTVTVLTSGVENGQSVTVTLNGQHYSAAVMGNSASVVVTAAGLQGLSDGQSYTLAVNVANQAGNPAPTYTSPEFRVDTSPPTLAIDTVAGDNVVNAAEKAAGVLVGGTSNAETGQQVTVVWGSSTQSVTVGSDGRWQTLFAAGSVPSDATSSTITANVSDAAGNAAQQASQTVRIDTAAPTVVINTLTDGTYNSGTADNILIADERDAIDTAGNWTVGGTAVGAENGQVLTLTLNGKSYSTTVTDGAWSVNIVDSDVLAFVHGSDYQLVASVSDSAGNPASNPVNLQVRLAPADIPTVQVLNTNTLTPTLGGVIAKEDPVNNGKYIALDAGDAFTVTVGTGSYTFTVGGNNPAFMAYNSSTKSWSLVLPSGVLSADGVYDVGVTVVVSGYPNKTDISSNELTIKQALPVVTVHTIAGDDVLNIAERAGALTLSGSVSDPVPGGSTNTAVGRTLSVGLNGQSYTATVQSNGDWSVTVPAADVAALNGASETVQVSYASVYGNTGSGSRELALDLSAPAFTSATSANVDENVAAGTVVYTAVSTDNAAVTYALKAGTGDAAAFSINTSTGVVGINSSPNFEAKSAYSFTVVATDAAGNVSERNVSLAVNNLNEVPTGLSLSATSVAENLGAGAVVATLSATDPDSLTSGFAAPFTFSLVSGSGDTDNAAFEVVGNELRLRNPANFENKASYTVRLRATDAAGLWTELSDTITVVNVPEVASAALSATGAQSGWLNAGDTVGVTLNWDLPVTVSTAGGVPTVTLDVGGTTVLASYVSGSGSTSLVFSATIASPMSDTNGVALVANSLALNGGTIRNGSLDATLSHSGLADNSNFQVDTTAPTVVITDSAADTVVNGPVTFTFTFSEGVSGFSADSVTVSANGSKGAFTTVSASVYTLVVTPQANSTGSLQVSVPAGAATDAAGNSNLASAPAQQAFDTQAPTVAITLSDSALQVDDTSVVTFAFSEAVTGFDNTDISAPNGTLSTVSTSNGGLTWTATFTPNAGVEDASNAVAITAGSYSDLAGNNGSGGSSANYAVDTLAPVAPNAQLSSDTTNGGAGFDSDTLTASGAITAPTNTEAGATLEYRWRFGATAFNNWTTSYTAPATNGSADGAYTVELRQTDAAGNVGPTQTIAYTLDTTGPVAPNIVLASDTGNGTAGADSDARTRSGALTTPSNIESGAVLQYRVQKDGGAFSDWATSYSAPATNGSADGSYRVETRQIDRAGNAGAVGVVTYTLDTTAPAQPNATLTTDSGVAGDAISNQGAITAPTNTESGAVLEYRVRLGTGVFGAWSTTYSAPATNGTADGAYTVELRQTDVAGNVGTAQSLAFVLDTQAPTVTIALADSALRIGETSLVTLTFSEAVTGFSNADLTVANGSLSDVSSSNGITWTATFTPSTNIEDTSNVIVVTNASYTDVAGNSGSGGSSANYAVDTKAPTVAITLADTALRVGEDSLVTFTFSEAVSGFSKDDVTVQNGSLGAVSSSDGITWTATFTPTANIEDSSNVIAVTNTSYTDVAGNNGSGASSANYTIDTKAPTVAITLADSALRIGETSLVTFTFSEVVSGFSNADLTVANGTLSTVASADGGRTWTATFTPTSNMEDTSNVISVTNASYTDVAGNSGSGGSSANYTMDTKAPTVSIAMADTALKAGESSLVTFTFSEAVSGFSKDDVVVENGSLGAVSSSDGITWTATFTPSTDTEDASNSLAVTGGSYTDAAGNSGVAGSSANYTVDTKTPTVSIAMADTALKAGESSLVTFTFSEAVSGFSKDDVVVENGSLGAVSSSDGITWTATFTPSTDTEDASNSLAVTGGSYTDAAGNSGVAGSSANYTVDTLAPSLLITLDDVALRNNETALVTFAFSEAVSGFSNGDIVLQNGTLSTVTSTDGGRTWRGTFTPTANTEAAANTITVANNLYSDAAGNSGTGASSPSYSIDTKAPTVTISMADTALRIGESSLVTFTFSEVVQEFTNTDISLGGGSLSTVTSSDGGRTWTATFTPSANIEDTTNVIAVTNASYTDTAGNTGSGGSGPNYSIDTLAPTVALALTAITDDEAPTSGTVDHNGSTNDTLPTLNGTLGGATAGATLATGDAIAVYRSPNMAGAISVAPNNLTDGQLVGSKVHYSAWDNNWIGVVKLPTNPADGDTVSITRASTWDFSVQFNGVVIAPSLPLNVTLYYTYDAAQGRWVDGYTPIGTATVTAVPGGQSTWTFQETSALAQGGVYNYAARVIDAAGNPGGYTARYRIVVSASATITAISDDTSALGDFVTSDTTLTITGTNVALAAGDKVQVSFDGSNWLDVTQTSATSWTYTAAAQTQGNYTLRTRVLGTGGVAGTVGTQALTIEPAAIDTSTYNTTTLNKTATAAQAAEAFEIDGVRYLMVANATATTSTLYRWNGSDFVVHQNVAINRSNDVRTFTIDGERYLVGGNGTTSVMRWDRSTSSFVALQSFSTAQAYDYELFTIGGVQYLVVSELSSPTSRVYRWAGSQFELAQTLTTSASTGEVGARDFHYFSIGSEQYLLASANLASEPNRIFRWNSATGQFVQHQDMANNTTAMDAEVVTIGSNQYLLQVDIGSRVLVYQWDSATSTFNATALQTINTNTSSAFEVETFQVNGQTYFVLANIGGTTSPLYRWNGSSFVFVQNVSSQDARDWEVMDMGGEQYLVNVGYLGNYARFYRFDPVTGQLVAANQTTLALGTNEDTPLSITASQLLANDGGATSITAVSAQAVDSAGVAYGTVALVGSNVVFTPNATADGLRQGDIKQVFFTYTNNSGAVRSVKVNITGVDNDASSFTGAGYRYDLSAVGNQTLTLTVDDVVRADGQGMGGFNQFNTGNGWTAGTYALGASENRYQVVVDGNAGDVLNIGSVSGLPGWWSYAGTVSNTGLGYQVYNHSAGTGQILLRDGMTLSDTLAPMLDLNAAVASQDNFTTFGNSLNLVASSSQYVNLPDVPMGGDMAFAVWINPRSFAQWSRVFDIGNGAAQNNLVMTMNSDGTVRFHAYNGSTVVGDFNSGAPITLNSWTHVAVSVDTSNVATMYINGVAAGSVTLSSAIPSLTRVNTWLGRSNWSADPYFDGEISDLRVYDIARTAAEINADMQGVSTASNPNLRLAYALNGSTLSSLSGQAAGTLVNGATFVSAYDRQLSLDNNSSPTLLRDLSAVQSVRVTPSDVLDGANEKLVIGGTSINANGSVASGSVTVDGTAWNWSFASGAFTFTTTGSSTVAQAQSLIQAMNYQNLASTATVGVRSFVIAVTDAAGNTGSQTALFSPLVISGAGTAFSTGVNQATTLSGKAAASASVDLNINGKVRTVSADAQGDWIYTLKQVPLVRYVMVRLDPGPDPYNTEGIFSLAGVQVFRNGVDVAAGRTATLSWGGTSSAVTDADNTVGVERGGAGEFWVQIDLGGLYAADQIKVYPRPAWHGRLVNADVLTAGFDMTGFSRAQLLADATVNKTVATSFPNNVYTYTPPNVGDADTLLAGNNTISASTVVSGNTITTQSNLTFNTGGQSLPPVVIDFNGDGQVTPSQVWTDLDGDGLLDLSDWVAPDDAILFHDKYRNGELLDSDQVAFQQYGGNTDLQGLAWAFDTNRDGAFDARDAEFEHFGLWRDLNQNAQVDADELQTLVSLGVEALVLTSDGQAQRVGNSVVYGQTELLFKDGSAMAAFDVALAYTSGADIAEAERSRQTAYTVI